MFSLKLIKFSEFDILGLIGPYWSILGHPSSLPRPFQALLNLTGSYWIILGHTVPSRALQGLTRPFTGPYRALVGLARLYWILLLYGLTGPYWAGP